MINSRVNLCCIALCGFLLSAPVPSGAMAQDETVAPPAPIIGAPRSLTPRPLGAPISPITEPQGRTISGGINVQTLDQVSNEAIGTLRADQAFQIDMWQGTPRQTVEGLLANLPAQFRLSALRTLQSTLLLSPQRPPVGTDGVRNLITLRAAKLFQMGLYQEAVELIETVPDSRRDKELIGLLAQSQLLKGDFEQVCSLSARQIQQDENPFWVKLIALCRMLAGQGDQAILSLNLLRETSEIDPLFDQLMSALQNGDTPEISQLPSANALGLALLKPSRATLDATILEQATQTLNMVLHDAPQLSVVQKANAVVTLSANGIFKNEALKDILRGFEFSDDQKGNALDLAQSLSPLEGQALLYQVASLENQITVIKTELIAQALDQAKTQGTLAPFSRLYAPLIRNLPARADVIWFAPYALQALLWADQVEAARRWFQLLQNAALSDATSQAEWVRITPLAILSGFKTNPAQIEGALQNWWQAQEKTPANAKAAARLFSLVEGLGYPLSDGIWTSVQTPEYDLGATGPKAGDWLLMNRSLTQQKRGQTLAHLLMAYNQTPGAQIHPAFLRDSLHVLSTMGHLEQARKLALNLFLTSER